ncbi:hypothetical protein B0H13DRAFT_1864470 [Mycena leptocephala]|nr:hypothetical protein B0H13DRAFT_1864470 [Mycena leptocephala]
MRKAQICFERKGNGQALKCHESGRKNRFHLHCWSLVGNSLAQNSELTALDIRNAYIVALARLKGWFTRLLNDVGFSHPFQIKLNGDVPTTPPDVEVKQHDVPEYTASPIMTPRTPGLIAAHAPEGPLNGPGQDEDAQLEDSKTHEPHRDANPYPNPGADNVKRRGRPKRYENVLPKASNALEPERGITAHSNEGEDAKFNAIKPDRDTLAHEDRLPERFSCPESAQKKSWKAPELHRGTTAHPNQVGEFHSRQVDLGHGHIPQGNDKIRRARPRRQRKRKENGQPKVSKTDESDRDAMAYSHQGEEHLSQKAQPKASKTVGPHSNKEPLALIIQRDEEHNEDIIPPVVMVEAKPYMELSQDLFAQDDGMQRYGTLCYKNDVGRWAALHVCDVEVDQLRD